MLSLTKRKLVDSGVQMFAMCVCELETLAEENSHCDEVCLRDMSVKFVHILMPGRALEEH